jgi:hypothetical protein
VSWFWETAVEQIVTVIASSFSKLVLPRIKRRASKAYDIAEIAESLNSGRIAFGDRIRVHGTFSEYVPFVDLASLLPLSPDIESQAQTVATCRLGDTVRTGQYIAALFQSETTNANAPSIPLLYSSRDPGKIFSLTTGHQVELLCSPVALDYEFRNILHRGEYFTFADRAFGLKVLDVCTKRPKKVNEFWINAFLLKSLSTQQPVEQFFDSLAELADIGYKEGLTGLWILCSLHLLHRKGRLALSFKEQETSVRITWLGSLIKCIVPVDILSTAASGQIHTLLRPAVFDHPPGGTGTDEMYLLRLLYDSETCGKLDQLVKNKGERRWLQRLTGRMTSRPNLGTAIDTFLWPRLAIDFQFDQVSPITKQTLDIREMLKRRGYGS